MSENSSDKISEQFFERHLKEVDWFWILGNTNLSIEFFKKHIAHYIKTPGISILLKNNMSNYFKRKNKSREYFKFDKQLIKLEEMYYNN